VSAPAAPLACAVVGSGPSGVACASALLARGAKVVMLDAGLRLEPEREALARTLAARAPEDWRPEELARLREPEPARGLPDKLWLGSDVPYRDAERALGIAAHGTGLRASLAFGGLSTVWGSAMLPPLAEDVADWPVPARDLAPHLRAALALTGLAAGRDRLEALFPLHVDAPASLPASRQAGAMLDAMERRAGALAAAGVYFGRARVAISPACVRCGLCMHGCPYGAIYNAGDTVNAWREHPGFAYRPDVLVERVSDLGGRVRVEGRRRESGERFAFDFARVFLACGVIPTTQILLRSLGAAARTAVIRDSQYFLVPALLGRRVAGVASERLHALAQLFVEIRDPAVSRHTVHLQVYSYNAALGRLLRARLGPLRRLAPLVRELEARLLVIQGFVHSAESGRIEARLERGDDGRERLALRGIVEPAGHAVVRRALRKLVANARGLGALALSPLCEVAAPGRGFHAGASFPMQRAPAGLASDLLPSVPATTITLAVMANAHRIGSEAPLP
jgi:ferredoxin